MLYIILTLALTYTGVANDEESHIRTSRFVGEGLEERGF